MNAPAEPISNDAAEAGRPAVPAPPGYAPPTRDAAHAARAFDPRRKSVPLACILSVMPGLGQIYVGYYRLGFVHSIVFACGIGFLANELIRPMIPLVWIFTVFFYLYNIVDAGRRAAFYNQALAGIDGVRLPQDMSLPSPGGSLVGGIVLIVVGLVLLSNTVLGISLYWLEQWWPAALIGFGIYLFLTERREKRPD